MTATKKPTKTASVKKATATKTASAKKTKPAKNPTATTGVTPAPIEPTPAPAAEKSVSKQKPTPEAEPKKLSALDAAAKVLGEAGEPMNAKAMIEAMATKGYWTSPGGKTPHATLYAAICREIAVKKAGSRFRKATPGHFAATKS